jgi:hypothetical protein
LVSTPASPASGGTNQAGSPELGGELLAAPAVADRDRDGALRRLLPDNVLVELRDDLAGRHHHAVTS